MSTQIFNYDCRKAATDIKYKQSIPKEPCFVSIDPSFGTVIGDSPAIELVEHRPGTHFAHEAGIYVRSNNKNYFTSNFQGGKRIDVYNIDCATREIEKVENIPAIVHANGGCLYEGKPLFCVQGSMTVPSSLTTLDPKTNETETLINNFHGREFNSVNDVVVHHKHDNDIWFTDPNYGYHQAFRPHALLPPQVYRFRPSTGQILCVADGFVECNGLCFSPDYSKLYVTDTGAVGSHGRPYNGHNVSYDPKLPATIYVFDVINGETLTNRATFAFADDGVPDGIKCDSAGNVYSGCFDGIHVWNPAGLLIGKIHVGCGVANFNFAKDGIWAFAEDKLFFVRLAAKGALYSLECE